MSLCCAETGRIIEYGEPLYVGTRSGLDIIAALCTEAVREIPLSSRRPRRCAPDEGGVDIHSATAGKNFNGAYAWSEGFAKKDFLFSISRETAMSCVPLLLVVLDTRDGIGSLPPAVTIASPPAGGIH